MKIPITFFAPAERKPVEVVQRQARSFTPSPVADTVFNASTNYLFVLNAERQIVMASENVLSLAPNRTMDQLIGLRPGEVLGCIHAFECQSGCGTSRFCCQCEAVRVILSGLEGSLASGECRAVCRREGCETVLQLQVQATPLLHNGERFILLTVAGTGHSSL